MKVMHICHRKSPLLFIQLPQLDNDVAAAHENMPLAAAYLAHAATRAGETRWYRPARLSATDELLDNAHLTGRLLNRQPAVIAATLYLWNVERTLRVLRAVRRRAPAVKIVVGGPEVARAHPFLFREGLADAAVAGEGEAVFPAILRALRGAGPRPDFTTVAWRLPAGGYVWGGTPPPPPDLFEALPPPRAPVWRPDSHGMAYLETSRGCPLSCAYCRYHHLRAGMSLLPVEAVLERVRILRARGAREIRFIDPMFNAHPRFTELLLALARLNADGAVAFFAEILADRLTAEQAALLKRAHFSELEVGLQCRRPAVLKAVRRAGTPARIENGLRLLTRQGMRVTLDLMYALPRQRRRDALSDLKWAAPLRRVNVQCMQTLLLPGTTLRRERKRWGITADPLPPYGVRGTTAMTEDDLRAVEAALAVNPRLRSDATATRFVGRRLPDIFQEEVILDLAAGLPALCPGRTARRAVRLRGADLFAQRRAIAAFITRTVRAEPDNLWQFVLEPRREEPLDLLDALLAALRAAPPHLLDRYAAAALSGRRAARRIFIRLDGRRFDPAWVAAAEGVLRAACY